MFTNNNNGQFKHEQLMLQKMSWYKQKYEKELVDRFKYFKTVTIPMASNGR